MADLPISALPELSESGVQSVDELVIVDASASETKKIKGANLFLGMVTQIPDASIPQSKIDVVAGDGTINTGALADKSVTAEKLADNSTGIFIPDGGTLIPAEPGNYRGQLGFYDDAGWIWDGVTWRALASVQLGLFEGQATELLLPTFETTGFGGVSLQVDFVDSTGPSQFICGPANAAGPITRRLIVGSDLPVATTSTRGAVRVDGASLSMDGETVAINNFIEFSSSPRLVAYNQYGIVTSGRAIQADDLPFATANSRGAVIPGIGLSIDGQGKLNVTGDNSGGGGGNAPIATLAFPGIVQPDGTSLTVDDNGIIGINNTVVAGTFTKTIVNEFGLVTGSDFLNTGDIPSLDASKISTGVFDPARIEDGSLQRQKLADGAVCYISESQPAEGTEYGIGGFWFKESTGILRSWNGNRWVPVNANAGGGGSGSLRFAGFVSAETGLINQLTDVGDNLPLTIGQPIPAVTAELVGAYLLVSKGGNQIGVLPGEDLNAGDQVVAVSVTEGWMSVATGSSDGGGGGGTGFLADLLDVDLDNVDQGQLLYWDAISGKWRNTAEIDANLGQVELRHQRSTQENFQPDVTTLPEGEIFLNINENSPGLWFKDSAGSLQSLVPVTGSGVDSIAVTGGALTVSNNGSDWTIGLPQATSSLPGHMSALDKNKLDGLPADAAPGIVKAVVPTAPLVYGVGSTTENVILNITDATDQERGVMTPLQVQALDAVVQTINNPALGGLQADWTETDENLASYIKNKPGLASDTEDGLMSSADKAKLDGITEGGGGGPGGIPEAPENGTKYARQDAGWTTIAEFPEAPVDGKQYARKDNGWEEVVATGGSGGIEEAPEDGNQYARQDAGWVKVEGGAAVYVGSTPPADAKEGDQWLDLDTTQFYVYAEDGGGSEQWINVAKQGPQGPPGGIAYTGENPPPNPSEGDVWIRATNLKQYVYMTDSDGSSQWASVICC